MNNEVEGYVPEYAETIERLKASVETVVAPLPGSEEDTYDRLEQLKAAAINRQNERTEAAGKEQVSFHCNFSHMPGLYSCMLDTELLTIRHLLWLNTKPKIEGCLPIFK